MMRTVTLHINGATHMVTADEDTPLLHVLRNTLDLKASRFGCGLEQCGACMVLVDGKPSYACTLSLWQCADTAIETAEGLMAGETPHPLVTAFLGEQAGQCGYCLSGILMSAKALLTHTPTPQRAEIIAALEPHLCRCGAQPRMVQAVERAARAMAGEPA
ncbi:(2Fe-2S)-binding protein [Azorhizobium sp. AG788]|uniref:(2Fe-2S)-binding protein n=1 Tax=Azorhizobium sp. AG788 TaxID=2183897 RepID=UPI003139B3C1